MANGWFQWYQVQDGDTLGGIALWWYGNGTEPYWRRLWLANRDRVSDPNQIWAGQWIRLPWWGFWCHIISGDTLWQLAEWVYGDGNQWEQIHDANPWIRDPDRIESGWWIWIP